MVTNREGQEFLVEIDRKQSLAFPRFGKDEGKLADLADRKPHQDGGPQRKPDDQGGPRGHEGLEEHDPPGDGQDVGGMPDKKPQIEEHAHGDEEKAREDIPEGKDVSHGLMAVFIGDDEPGQEGAQARVKALPRRSATPRRDR